ncbi:MAG: hypothetical protein J6C81_08580 [Muribaculaceae bacterium]|nr:hypothetical protein [Muribaculaceae bacterium]
MKITKLLCAALMVGALASCSDDEPKQRVFEENTFTDKTGLTMMVNDAQMYGGIVKYTPGADNTVATLTVTTEFDLEMIPGIEGMGIEGLDSYKLAGPGVIPGSKELVLPVRLTDVTEDHASFSGSYETQYCTFNYNGEITKENLILNFTDVLLKNPSIVGDYKTLPFAIDEDTNSENYGGVLANPIYINWESGAGINLLGSPVPPKVLLSLVMVMPLLNDNQLTVPQALNEALQGVSFAKTGDVIAKIKEDIADPKAPVVTSPANLAQYVLTGSNSMLFFLNPNAIAVADATRTRADLNIDFSNLFGNAIAQLAPMLSDGVPMSYKADGKNLTVYLGTETLLPLLKQISPLLENEELINQLVEMVSADPSMGMFAAFLPDILKSVPEVIEKTTVLEVGINLVKE